MDALRLEGSRIRDISSLYAELDRVLMPQEEWRLGESLDALNDLLHGGYGVLAGAREATIVWADHAVSRAALGVATTRAWYEAKLARPDVYSARAATAALATLADGTGPTYFDLVLGVFAGHPGIRLLLE